jgi:WD40 repeat protein
VKVWDATRDDSLQQPFSGLGTIVVSPDGSRTAELARSGLGAVKGPPKSAVLIRDLAGTELTCFRGHAAEIWSLRFSPDGRYVVSYDGAGEQKVWEATTGTVLLSQKWPAAPDASFDPTSGKSLVPARPFGSGGKGRPFVFTDVPFEARPVFSRDGSRLAAGVPGGGIKVWDLADGKEIYAFKGHTMFLHLSRDSCRHFTFETGTVRLRDAATGKEIPFQGGLLFLKFSPDGKFLAASPPPERKLAEGAPFDLIASVKQVKVWDASTGAEVATLTSEPSLLLAAHAALAFSPDGKRLAAIATPVLQLPVLGAPGEVLVWDIATGQELFRLKGHASAVRATAFSPDGKRIATASPDGVKLWDAASGKELLSLKSTAKWSPSPVELFFSRDGTRLFLQASHQSGRLSARPEVWDATPLPEQ